jgi:amino acid adenylation domain-containing protein
MLTRDNIQDAYRLSPLQEGMLYHALMDPDSAAYFQQMTCEIKGWLDPAIFREAWRLLVDRHDILRTIFVHRNVPQPLQFVLKKRELEYRYEDLDGLALDEQERRLVEYLAADRGRKFQLHRDRLVRMALFRRSAERHALVMSFHHILLDGWSGTILAGELKSIYPALARRDEPRLPPPVPYKELITWLDTREKSAAEGFWRDYLAGYAEPVGAPGRGTAGNGSTGSRREHRFALNEETTTQLVKQAARIGVTLNCLVQTAWGLVLGHANDVEDVVFGTTVSGRNAKIKDVERLVGLCINTVPVRVRWDRDQPIEDLLRKMNRGMAESMPHQFLSLPEIQAVAGPRDSLFDHLLIFENYPDGGDGDALGEPIRFESFAVREETHLGFEIKVVPGLEIAFAIGYDGSNFDARIIASVEKRIRKTLATIVEEPSALVGRLDLVDNEERALLLPVSSAPSEQSASRSIPAIFREQVAKHPDKLAVIAGDVRLTYAELDRLSDRIAGAIGGAVAIRPDDCIALMLDRSEWLVAGILGVLKAGAAYVPLDPDHPRERIETVVKQSECWLMLTEERFLASYRDLLPAIDVRAVMDSPPVTIRPRPDHLAYLTFTSGSTGAPKGVMVAHANVAAFRANMETLFGIVPGDRLLALTTVTFDISVLELVVSLLHGLTVVVAPSAAGKNPGEVLDLMEGHAISVLQITPSHLRMLIEPAPDRTMAALRRLRVLLVGGEALPEELFDRLRPLLPSVRIFNVYGPTETTIWSTAKDLRDGRNTIGRPLVGEEVYIVSKERRLMPVGSEGEILIGGSGVSRGYFREPALTADKFIDDPFHPGRRLYRTGDHGRWLPDATIEFRGRRDGQVKIRGNRVELGEIEGAAMRHPEVTAAAAALRTIDGDVELALYVVSKEKPFDPQGLREHLRRSLPPAMVPSRFVFLDALPLSPNGKLDRARLPTLDRTVAASGEVEPPATELEKGLVIIWEEILQVSPIGVTRNFFDLGGHSLKAMRLISRISRDLHLDVTLGELTAAPTIRDLAALLENRDRAEQGRIEPVGKKESYQLSPAQKRWWILDQMKEVPNAYNMPLAHLVRGDFDLDALRAALAVLIGRHDILRTVFVEKGGEPFMKILESMAPPVTAVDVSAEADALKRATALAETEAATPFDLSQGPLWRILVVRIAAREQVVVVNMHHIITEAWSFDLFFRDLAALYERIRRGEVVEEARPAIQYQDYAAWMNASLGSHRMERQRRYWLEKMKDPPPPLNLPLDRARPDVYTFEGRTLHADLDSATAASLERTAREAGVSLFTTLASIVSIFLHRVTGQEEIVVGTPVTGRRHPDLAEVRGVFVNTLALRTGLAPSDSLRGVMKRVKTTVTEAYDHQDYPFELLVSEVDHDRSMSRSPVFEVMVVLYEDEAAGPASPGELQIEPFDLEPGISRYLMTFLFIKDQNGIRVSLNYYSAVLDETTARGMIERLMHLMTGLVRDPNRRLDECELLCDEEKRRLLELGQGATRDYPAHLLMHELVEAQAARTPERIAVEDPETAISYGRLVSVATVIAAHLRDEVGVRAGTTVALLLERNAMVLPCLLGIMKAGATYLPLDHALPRDRMRYMLEECGCRVVLADAAGIAALEGIEGLRTIAIDEIDLSVETPNASFERAADSPAYVIFTSGSTGLPKGVKVGHAGFINMILEQVRIMGVRADDRALQFAALTFDASLAEIFLPLACGATLVVAPRRVQENTDDFLAFLREREITVMTLPPAYLACLNRQSLDPVRVLVTAGEAARVEDALHYGRRLEYFNGYGPTEYSVCTSLYRVSPSAEAPGSIPIGRPIANSRITILDDALRLRPCGWPGEICVSGPGTAIGYLGGSDADRARFIPDPFVPGQRMYRTGDIGRWLPDGNLEFLGRRDGQVKVHGYRIECGEIEAALERLEVIRQAKVVAREIAGARQLIAYLLPAEESVDVEAQADRIKTDLARDLPRYMIPTRYVAVASFPVTSSGKIDIAKLPLPAADRRAAVTTQPARDSREAAMLRIWEEVLGIIGIGIHDNFFDLGGNSLQALQAVTRMAAEVGGDLTLRRLFRNPTVAALSRHQ